MRIVVLGAAAGGGFPQWNCGCGNCRRARAGDAAARPRTQSSLAVSADSARWVLLNASPDLRQQIAATPALWPQAPRHSPIAAVVLTSGDVDHVAGLLSLREGQPFVLHAGAPVLDALAANPIFASLDPAVVRRAVLPRDEPVALCGPDGAGLGLAVEAFAVPGKVPLYLERGAVAVGSLAGEAVGLRVSDGARSFFYVPGCAAVTPALAARLRGAALVFFDGTLWRDDELIRLGLGAKTGRRMGHVSIEGPDGSLAAFAGLGVGRKVFVHVNNSNPVLLDDSPERMAVAEAGWEVAWDGMEIAP